MITRNTLRRWLLALFYCPVIFSLPYEGHAARPLPRAPSQLTVMIMIHGQAQERSQLAENTLAQAFLQQGYKVIDAATVTQNLRRHAYLLQQAELETAKRLGSGLGADIVISGEVKMRVVDKTYTLLEGKKVILGQGDVTVKAVLTDSGRVIVAENAFARKPFDTTGQIALQMAAEAAAGKLIHGIEAFLKRDTTAYRLVVLNIDDSQALTFQESLRQGVKGVRQVDESRARQNRAEINVSVEKDQELPFKQSLFSQLSNLGLGTFEVVAGEGETIYLRKAESSMSAQPKLHTSPLPQPPGSSPPSPGAQDTVSREPPPGVPQEGGPSIVSTPGPTQYTPGYRKSWAVLIGINEYQHWPKLQYAVNDARAIESLVKGLGFDEVIMVLDGDATEQRIRYVLGDELHAKTQDNDRVFIFFAGHGQTQDLPDGMKDGFIIPVDGDLNNYYSTAISMQQLQRLADRIRAKHILYVMDACFSGLLLRLRGEALHAPPRELTIASARQVLTAGTAGEKVAETGGHGLFTKSLLNGLGGAADRNQDGYITASELYQYISPQVLAESRNTQNPVFGRLGYGQGEFVFVGK
jgi:hypothetical protein